MHFVSKSGQSHNAHKKYKCKRWINTDLWTYQRWKQMLRRSKYLLSIQNSSCNGLLCEVHWGTSLYNSDFLLSQLFYILLISMKIISKTSYNCVRMSTQTPPRTPPHVRYEFCFQKWTQDPKETLETNFCWNQTNVNFGSHFLKWRPFWKKNEKLNGRKYWC